MLEFGGAGLTLALHFVDRYYIDMDRVFIYWDNSNIWISAKGLAEHKDNLEIDARERLRIHFPNLYRLAAADRRVERAHAVGSIPPELRHLWYKMEGTGIHVTLLERGAISSHEQGVDATLQTKMLFDLAHYNGDPGIAVLLTGDGAGFYDGVGFYAAIELMHKKGWRIEVLSWSYSCNPSMQKWAEEHGLFISLDNYYENITFLERALPGRPVSEPRKQAPLDLATRPHF